MKLNVAIIGCGRKGTYTQPELRENMPPGWLPYNHAEAIIANKNLNLVSLCDINDQNLQRAKTRFKVPGFYDYKNCISKIKPDIVSIATRTKLRKEIIKYTIENGVKGLHIEKPISTNLKDCNESICLIIKHDIKVTYGPIRRYMDTFQKANLIIKSGEMGKLRQITIEQGNSLLLWTHPHSVDTLLYFAGTEIDYVQANCDINNYKSGVVDEDPTLKNALVQFKEEVIGLITTATSEDVIIDCEKGRIRITEKASKIILERKNEKSYTWETSILPIEPKASGTQRAFTELGNSIITNQPSPIDPIEIRLNQNILLAFALSSLTQGKRIKLSMVDEEFTVTGKFGDLYP
jgi:scyllo-inositol 2-dehydrogenase (NAD+)